MENNFDLGFQFCGELFTELRCFFDRAFGLGAPDTPIGKGEGTHAKLVAADFGISRDRALTAAAHRSEKSAFGGHALLRVEVVEPLTNRGDALVLRARFNEIGRASCRERV